MADDLAESGRSRALAVLGLGACADSDLDYYAQRVRDRLGVPVALVSLVQVDGQVFPGQSGLGARRSAPLSHSLCHQVVRTRGPLAVADTRLDSRVAGDLAIGELGVVAYAGMPVTDSAGHVLGALCAIDHRPRAWTDDELATLDEVARACSTQVRLRLARHEAEASRRRAHTVLRRAQLLLTASEDLADTPSVVELRNQIDQLVAGEIKPARVELLITQDRGVRATAEDRHDPTPGPDRPTTPGQWDQFDPEGPLLTAQVVREKRIIHHADLSSDEHAGLSDVAVRYYLDAGLVAVAVAPVVGLDGVLGVLEFAWDQPHESDPVELAVIANLAGYVAIALQRARRLQSRVFVAREMQEAMLSELPRPTGLDIAARYHPAAASELVGGDWYDAFALPMAAAPETMAIVVGDVAGHDIHAATGMGQFRAMLRQTCWDHQAHDSPAAALTRLDQASHGLRLASATAILGYLRPLPDGTGRWSLTWSNAGHPPPVLVHPDRTSRLLEGGDVLLGCVDLVRGHRRDHRVVLDPGSTLVFYTDGLVERRGRNTDVGLAALARLAAEPAATAADHIEHILTVMTATSPAHDDDVVILAVRIR